MNKVEIFFLDFKAVTCVLLFVVGFDITPDAGTTLRKMTKCGIDDKLDSLEIVSVGADKELQLQKSLVAMINEWDSIDIPIGKYKETDIAILGNCDDIQVG